MKKNQTLGKIISLSLIIGGLSVSACQKKLSETQTAIINAGFCYNKPEAFKEMCHLVDSKKAIDSLRKKIKSLSENDIKLLHSFEMNYYFAEATRLSLELSAIIKKSSIKNAKGKIVYTNRKNITDAKKKFDAFYAIEKKLESKEYQDHPLYISLLPHRMKLLKLKFIFKLIQTFNEIKFQL